MAGVYVTAHMCCGKMISINTAHMLYRSIAMNDVMELQSASQSD